MSGLYVIDNAEAIARLVGGYKPRKKENLKKVKKSMTVNGKKRTQSLWVKK